MTQSSPPASLEQALGPSQPLSEHQSSALRSYTPRGPLGCFGDRRRLGSISLDVGGLLCGGLGFDWGRSQFGPRFRGSIMPSWATWLGNWTAGTQGSWYSFWDSGQLTGGRQSRPRPPESVRPRTWRVSIMCGREVMSGRMSMLLPGLYMRVGGVWRRIWGLWRKSAATFVTWALTHF